MTEPIPPSTARDAEALRTLDQYLSLHAGQIFAPPGNVERKREGQARGRRAVHRIGIAVLGGALMITATQVTDVGGGWRRGRPSRLAASSSVATVGYLEFSWAAVPGATHYSLEAWNLAGDVVASQVLEGQTTTLVEVPPTDPSQVFWSVTAWSGTRRLAASGTLSLESK
jgi:hypothetical protein